MLSFYLNSFGEVMNNQGWWVKKQIKQLRLVCDLQWFTVMFWCPAHPQQQELLNIIIFWILKSCYLTYRPKRTVPSNLMDRPNHLGCQLSCPVFPPTLTWHGVHNLRKPRLFQLSKLHIRSTATGWWNSDMWLASYSHSGKCSFPVPSYASYHSSYCI